mmetsp:Transcript_21576/g.40933  ORF Transcript_21576/g.40933 Transcript_21576/m.40933 type:complete len:202 (-) Transcript_21576:105-710(-)
MNATELQHDIVLIIAVAKLKILDRGHTYAASEIQHKRTQFNVPPGRSILQRHQTKVIATRSSDGIDRIVVVSVVWFLRSSSTVDTWLLGVKIVETLQKLPETCEHAPFFGFIHTLKVASPICSCHAVRSHPWYTDVHDPRPASQKVGSVCDDPIFFFRNTGLGRNALRVSDSSAIGPAQVIGRTRSRYRVCPITRRRHFGG